MDYTTSLAALAQRAVDAAVDKIAKDGVVALRRVLERSGFGRSQHLKDYDVLAHVRGDTVEFEILVDASAIEDSDEVRAEAERAEKEAEAELQDAAARTFALEGDKAVRVVGMRGRKDARTGAKDARLTYKGRLIRHEMALRAPRSMSINRKGKLSLRFKRSVRETEKGFEYPTRKREGIVAEMFEAIESVVAKAFLPEIKAIVERTLA